MNTDNYIAIEDNQSMLMTYDAKAKKHKPTMKKNTEEFISALRGNEVLLPEGTRYFNKYGTDKYFFITEEQPVARTIFLDIGLTYRWNQFKRWCNENDHKDGIEYFTDKFKKKTFPYGHYKFYILTPHIIYLTNIMMKRQYCSVQVYVSPKPLTTLNNCLYVAPFYNMTSVSYVCMGMSVLEFPKTPEMVVKKGTSNFWRTSFNSDYDANMKRYAKIPQFCNYFIWEYITKTDPLFLYQTGFAHLLPSRSVKRAIENNNRSMENRSMTEVGKLKQYLM